MTGPTDADATAETRTLSTGHTVQVPLTLAARITGAAFPAPLARVRDLLPDGLRPLRVTPRRGAVTVLSVDYRRIGDDAMAPYDELSVQIPAVEDGRSTVPVVSGWLGCTSGYVWDMPVTTEPAKALGVEVWGYPKEVADVSIEHGPSRTRTTVDVDGQRLLSTTVKRPPSVSLRLSGHSLSELDGDLIRADTAVEGEVGAWPASERASVAFGDHPRARTLRDVGLGGRAVQRLAADCRFTLGPPRPVSRSD